MGSVFTEIKYSQSRSITFRNFLGDTVPMYNGELKYTSRMVPSVLLPKALRMTLDYRDRIEFRSTSL